MSRCGRFALNLAAMAALAGVAGGAAAQSASPDPYMAKQLSNAVRGNLFMRLGYTSIGVKTKSSDAVDVTGPVVTAADIRAAAAYGDSLPDEHPLSAANLDYNLAAVETGDELKAYSGIDGVNILAATLERNGLALGTPPGIKSKAGDSATLTLSIGYWLSDDHTWVAEAYVLAAPLTVKAYGEGVNARGRPNGLNGKQILETKMLPPLAVLGRYFGPRDQRVRPYLGIGGTYAVFFDTRTTSAYDSYVGGRSTAKLKNAFGVGPFAGLMARLSDNMHLSVAIGTVQIKTEASVTTYNTMFKTGDGVLQDYPQTVVDQINATQNPRNRAYIDSNLVTKLTQLIAETKGGSDLGTYTRKQKQTLDNTIFNISLGYSF